MQNTQALARKWRPRNFSELVGQEHVVRALRNALDQQRLHHAYLLTGTRGVGKTTLARIMAKALNCAIGVTSSPCGVCGACTEIDAGRFMDLIELDAASNTQVDNMRDLLENAQYLPTSGRFKVYIIDEVHMLSKSAFNAMLKTLEEPPEHVKFVLATTDPQKIPVTVLSRCLQFNLKQLAPSQINGQLQAILEREAIAFEIPALVLLARAAQGSMRDALSLLDQAIAHGAGSVTETGVRDMLGAIDQTYLFEILKALASRDGAELIAQADRMQSRTLSFDAALQDLATLLHRIALAQSVPAALAEDEPERASIFELAAVLKPEDVQLFYQFALQGRDDLALAPDEYAGFTMTLLRMLAFMPNNSGSAAVAGETRPAGVAQALPSSAANHAQDSELDWPRLIAQLKLGGMVKMLAQHCELVNREDALFEFRITEANRRFNEKPFRDKLKAALEQHFGKSLRVNISIGESEGDTPSTIEKRERDVEQAKAEAAIAQDPFVRELVENFGGRVSSIQPLKDERSN